MIFLDYNQIALANLMQQIGWSDNKIDVDIDLIRHMILNSIRSYNSQFKREYGELIIACDDITSWRKEIFPYYKANRKKDRDASSLDWNSIFEALNKIREELKLYFPYRVLCIDRVEGDDIIATLSQKYGEELNNGEKLLIISRDHDFGQLQIFGNVSQFDPIKKSWIKVSNPEKKLKEHIIKGDTGDGIPNILSDDDTFVIKEKRQKPIHQKKLNTWIEDNTLSFLDDEYKKNRYLRNQQLIDFFFIPKDIQNLIFDEYDKQQGKTKTHLLDYFMKNKLKNLMSDLQDF